MIALLGDWATICLGMVGWMDNVLGMTAHLCYTG